MNLKRVITFLFITFSCLTIKAQPGYFSIHAGYAFGFGNSIIGYESIHNNVTTIYGSFGEGVHGTVRIGQWFSKHLAGELALGYFQGIPTTSDIVIVDKSRDLTTRHSTSQIRFTPSVMLSTGQKGFTFYTRVGIPLIVSGNMKTSIEGISASKSFLYKATTVTRFSAGFLSVVGVNYDLSDRVSIFGEFEGIGLTAKSKSSEVTTLESAGINNLPGLETYDKETTFVDALTSSSNNFTLNPNADETKPREALASKVPFNSAGINIGIRFNF